MTVTKVYVDEQLRDITDFDHNNRVKESTTLKQLLTIGALCNNAEYKRKK